MALVTVPRSDPSDWAPPLGFALLERIEGEPEQALFRIGGTEPRLLLLVGSGFTYGVGFLPEAGTITALRIYAGETFAGAQQLHDVTGIAVSAASLAAAVGGGLAGLLFAGADTLLGGSGADRLAGWAGDDLIRGGTGSDRLEGGAGNDTMLGESGNDAIFGGAGDDLLEPGSGRDVVRGGVGNDTIRLTEPEPLAGLGEILDGGAGDDMLAIALPQGALLDLGQAQVMNIEAIRFEAGVRLAISAAALAAIETVVLDYAPRVAGGNAPGFVLRGAGVFVLNGFAIEGLEGDRRLTFAISDDDGGIVFGRDGGQDQPDDTIMGGAGASSLFGGDGADSLAGGGGNDLLEGEDGADTLGGGAGNDLLAGGQGNDLVIAGEGADTLDGGAGADTLRGTAGSNLLRGGDGDDRLEAGAGGLFARSTLEGGAGNDTLIAAVEGDVVDGGPGNDLLLGGAEDDRLSGSAGNDTARGGNGDDRIEGGDARDFLFGEDGSDTLDGGAGEDSLYGGTGDDSLEGGTGNDLAFGGDGFDRMRGGAGNDTMLGEGGADRLFGEEGDDRVDGGDGADTLDGGPGADTLNGGAGNDVYIIREGEGDVFADSGGVDAALVAGGSFTISSIFENAVLLGAGTLYGNGAANLLDGSDFADLLIGGNGHDTLVGGPGADTLSGGNGNDVYRITDEIGLGQPGGLGDRILNFGRVAGSNRDLIDVSHYTPITGSPALGFQSVVAFGSADDGKAGVISYQVLGGAYTILRGYQGVTSLGLGSLEFEIRVDIAGPWTSADFIL